MIINQKQVEAVIALPGEERYKYFVKKVADWQKVWGLYEGGWALAGTDDGVEVFPFWPAKEFADASACGAWAGFEARSIPLSEFMDELLPKIRRDGVLPGVFFTPNGKGVTPSVDHLLGSLRDELRKY